MATLLQFMQNHLAIGLHDTFAEDIGTVTAEEALSNAFIKLHTALTPHHYLKSPVVFSADSFDETLIGLLESQEDKFAEQIVLNLGNPHAKICHMRHYTTEKGSHWHALFAQLDETGEIQKITLTDSRTLTSQGITASRDIQLNPFLQAQRKKIEFIPGLQQPSKTPICWIYSLANLASLASTGRVYEPQQGGDLGEELSQFLKQEPPLRTQAKASAKSSKPINSTTFFYQPSTSIPPTIEEETQFFIDNTHSLQKKKSSSLNVIGGSLLLFGAGTLVAGGLVLTAALAISIPLGFSLIALGLILTLTGAIVLTAGCIKKAEVVEESTLTMLNGYCA